MKQLATCGRGRAPRARTLQVLCGRARVVPHAARDQPCLSNLLSTSPVSPSHTLPTYPFPSKSCTTIPTPPKSFPALTHPQSHTQPPQPPPPTKLSPPPPTPLNAATGGGLGPDPLISVALRIPPARPGSGKTPAGDAGRRAGGRADGGPWAGPLLEDRRPAPLSTLPPCNSRSQRGRFGRSNLI
jgi:hypothetical protein